MIKILTNSLILISLLFVSQFSFAASTGSAKVNFTGSIIGTSCGITTNNLNVQLGVWALNSKGSRISVGDTTEWVEFDLVFQCAKSTMKVNGILQGTAAPKNNNAFAITPSSTQATGMAIQVEYYNEDSNSWVEVGPNKSNTFRSASKVVTGENIVRYRARYLIISEEQTPGTANTSVTYVVEHR